MRLRIVITLAALLATTSVHAKTLPTLPDGAAVCAPDPTTGERAVILPPRYETYIESTPVQFASTELFVLPPLLADDGRIARHARVVERVIPVLYHPPTRRRIVEPARSARLSDFSIGDELLVGTSTTNGAPKSWDYHLEDYVRQLKASQIGATEPRSFDGEVVLTPKTIDLDIAEDAPANIPVRIIIDPFVITQESEGEAVDAYRAAAREWAASIPDTLVCDGHEVASKPIDLGPMPERSFTDIGVRRVMERRGGSIKLYDRTGAEVRP